jgi:TonB family protein
MASAESQDGTYNHMSTGAPVSQRGALPIGTRVQEFEIVDIVGGGGFGIVYLARDQSLQRRVALKEYMPPMASRLEGTARVVLNFAPDAGTFGAGLRNFLLEARLLARFDHPALVKVHRFWEENGTAYMAMPFYDGPTLQRAVAENKVPASEHSLRALLSPLLDALAALHREQCYHRDISPDNILLTATGPVLLDFGAARMAIGNASQNFTVVLKEGYAPVEQYATEGVTAMRQGPWTDIYALAGVIRYVITGNKPPSAVARIGTRSDAQEPLTRLAAGRYSVSFLRALDVAMALYADDRPQSIEQLRALLDGRPTKPAPVVSQEPGVASQPVAAHLALAARWAVPRLRKAALVLGPLILLVTVAVYAILPRRPATLMPSRGEQGLHASSEFSSLLIAPAAPGSAIAPPAPSHKASAATASGKAKPSAPLSVHDGGATQERAPMQQPSQSAESRSPSGLPVPPAPPVVSAPVQQPAPAMDPAGPTVSPKEPVVAEQLQTPAGAHPVVLLRGVKPVYPQKALQQGVNGSVTVEFTIDMHGDVKDVRVVNAVPAGMFERAVIAAVKRSHYQPLPSEVTTQQVFRFNNP